MTNWTISIPSDPTPKLVLVENVSAEATADKVKEFFLFCGKITEFELVKTEATQSALIMFEKESAAKTATMLSNAVIADTQIQVRYYFDKYSPSATDAAAARDGQTAEADSQEHKPKTGIITEIIAAGYHLSEAIIERAKAFDAQYGVSTKMQSYYQQALGTLASLNERYSVTKTLTNKAGELDEKYHIKEKGMAAVGQVKAAADSAMQSAPALKAQELYNTASATVVTTLEQGRQLANEKFGTPAAGAAAAAPAAEDKKE